MADDTTDNNDVETWQAGTFDWNVDPDKWDNYSVEEGSIFAIDEVKDVTGAVVPAGDYTVLYFEKAGAAAADTDTLVNDVDSMTGVAGGMPKEANDYGYIAMVVKTPVVVGENIGQDGLGNDTTVAQLKADGNVWYAEEFTVVAEQKTLSGAFAFEVNDDDAKDVSDRTFSYTGNNLNVKFADAEGNVLEEDADYTVAWIQGDGTVKSAGSYTAVLYGVDDYAGTQETVSFEVAKLDLAKAKISVDIVDINDGFTFTADKNVLDQSEHTVYADGVALAGGAVKVTLVSYVKGDGTAVNDPNFTSAAAANEAGEYLFKVEKPTAASSDVANGPATFTSYVVEQLATVTYDDADADAYFTDRVFQTSKGQGFDPDLFEAKVGNDDVKVAATVTKDGQEVQSYDEPGKYQVLVEVAVPATCKYGFSKTYDFTVVTKQIGDVSIFAVVDGKSVAGNQFPYTGQAYTPAVVVKEGNKTLVVGEDYTVAYRAKKTQEAVESMVEPGTYEIVISYPGTQKQDSTVDFELVKAELKSAKSAKQAYAWTDSVIAPDFVGYTGDDLSGTAVDLPNDGVGARYWKATWTDLNWDDVVQYDELEQGDEVNPTALVDEGWYIAEISVASSNAHYQGNNIQGVFFEISETAGYADVAADAWYADSVYQARDNGYMQGVAAGIFAPEQPMTRAEFAQVVANMAGVGPVRAGETYPTKFSDVPSDAWFAKAVEWASRYGIVTGKSATEFDPYGTITREEIATMLYRYAGNGAQADASALDAFVDGAQVSDWAKNAMAWAVEEGHMNGKGNNDLDPQGTALRCEIAALSVRVQPEAL